MALSQPAPGRDLLHDLVASAVVLAFGVALVVLSVAFPALEIARDREASIEAAHRANGYAARVLAEHVAGAVEDAKIALGAAERALRERGAGRPAGLGEVLAIAAAASPTLRSLSIVSPAGAVLASSDPGNVGRPWAPAAASLAGPGGVAIDARPVMDIAEAADKKAPLYDLGVSRVLRGPDGGAWSAVAVVDGGHVARQLRAMVPDEASGALLETRAGSRLAAVGLLAKSVAPGGSPPAAGASTDHEGTGRAGVPAFTTTRALRDVPLLVTVETDAAAALAGWNAGARRMMLIGFVLASVSLVLTWTAWAGLRERERVQAREAPVQAALLETGALSRAVLDTAVDPIVMLDERGTVLDWNAAAERVFGYTREAAIGRAVSDLIVPAFARDDARVTRNPFLTLGEGFGLDRHIEMAGQHAGGVEIPMQVTVNRVRVGDGPPVFTAFLQDISHRKRGDESLRESEQKYRRVVESIREGIYQANPRGEITFANSAFAAITGVPPDSLMGRRLDAFIAPAERDVVARLIADLPAGSLAGVAPPPVELTLAGEGGAARIVRLTAQPVLDSRGDIAGLAGTIEDVTEARRAQKDLADQLRFTRELIDAVPTPILVKNLAGEFLSVNRAWEEFMALDRSRVVGRSVIDLEPEKIAERYMAEEREVLEHGRAVNLEDTVVNAAGALRHTRVAKVPFRREDGTIAGLIGTFVDMTDARAAQRQVLEAKEAAERANEAKSTFLANMSHEIRTPMNGIIGMTQLAMDGPLSADQRQYLELVLSSADSLLEIINDILDLSKIEADRLAIEAIEYSPRDLVAEVSRLLAMRAQQRGLEFVADVDADVPARAIGDPMRLRQVLVNLLGNAIKFTAAGYVAVSVQRIAGERPTLRFAVSDSGIGIPPERQAEVFKAFSQADESITRRFGGTGLGLAICARLVALMGGTIELRSRAGAGSTFSFSIALQGEVPVQAPRPEAFAGRRVLVIEPDDLARGQARRLLDYLGAQAESEGTAETGRARLDAAQREGRPFGIVLVEASAAGPDPAVLLAGLDPAPRAILMRPMDTQRGPAGFELVRKPLLESTLLALCGAVGSQARGAGEAAAPAEPLSGAPDMGGLDVLVAEDHPVNQLLVRRLLERAGCRVSVAGDGREALELATARPFDVILMDVQMPEMGGHEATRRLREREAGGGRRTPVIALTAHAHESDRQQCLAAGMDDYLSKPVNPGALHEALERWAPHRVSRRSAPAVGAPPPVRPEASPDGPSASADAPLFRRAAFEESIGNDPVLFANLIDLFFEVQPDRLRELGEQLASGDAEAGRRTAHTLVGSFRTMAMPRMGDLAAGIEQHLKAGEIEPARERYTQLEATFPRLAAELTALRATLPGPQAPASPAGV